MGMISSPPAPPPKGKKTKKGKKRTDRKDRKNQSRGKNRKTKAEILAFRLPFQRIYLVCLKMRLRPLLTSGLPLASTAVMSLNFASLNQQRAQVPTLNPLNYCLAFPNSGV
jgi:hypothetical protein